MPLQLSCLPSSAGRFNFKIPRIVFGLRFASIPNPKTPPSPKTHLISQPGDERVMKIDFMGVKGTASRAVCLSKIGSATFRRLKKKA